MVERYSIKQLVSDQEPKPLTEHEPVRDSDKFRRKLMAAALLAEFARHLARLEHWETYKFALVTAFAPIFWNSMARLEYRTRVLTRIWGCGDPNVACAILGISIFSLGLFRDYLYKCALEMQPVSLLGFEHRTVSVMGALLAVSGNVLVLSSMYKLGFRGTYLGDYFGLLKSERVTSFPFSIMANPMYNGSTMTFLGAALWYHKVYAGLLLSFYVWLIYRLALWFEEPFTAKIYTAAALRKQSPAKGAIQSKTKSEQLKAPNVSENKNGIDASNSTATKPGRSRRRQGL